MSSPSWNQTQPRKVKSLSQGHTAAAEPGLTPRGARLQEPLGGESQVAASDEATEMGPVTDLSPPGATFVSQPLSLLRQAASHPPGQSLGLLIKLRFITATPRWRSCLPGKGTARRGAMAPWPPAMGPPDWQVGLWTWAIFF